tara:strand:+ start:143 stop:1279 length:1137 start_codon:yes stop_codon:yes gene_type:complete
MKVSVVGGGNAAVFTALYLAWHGKESDWRNSFKKDIEVELIYDPKIPCERVGQATLVDPPRILWSATGFNWYKNQMHATFKSGILYEGWGKVNDTVYHAFPADFMAMHYCPWEMQKHVINSGIFKVIESNVDDINNIDSDLIFDCRGKPKDFADYDDLINPINACVLGKPNWDTTKAFWSRHVATPDGWTFVIPTHSDSPSHDYSVGYCYNSNITSKEEAEKNMLKMFDVSIKKNINIRNYVAKNPIIDDRIVLNGNKLFFVEPLESSSVQSYIEMAIYVLQNGVEGIAPQVRNYIKQIQNFVLWHYQFGSKYDTPFWDYAKSLTFIDSKFDYYLRDSKQQSMEDLMREISENPSSYYAQWSKYAFKLWYNGMTEKEK